MQNYIDLSININVSGIISLISMFQICEIIQWNCKEFIHYFALSFLCSALDFPRREKIILAHETEIITKETKRNRYFKTKTKEKL